jgi:SAM-dependent methyltransferase
VENTELTPEMETLKTKLKAVWSAGNFSQIARAYETGASDFVAGLNLKSGMQVLDVACGAGNLSLPAARTGAEVTGVDIAAYLIEQAHANAESENVKIQFDVGDAENLPYADSSFDVVMTMFGAMFAPRPEIVASELKRVTRSGGRIAMANWTPAGFVGQMFKLTGKHVPPPNMPSPVLWGDENAVQDRFKEGIADLKMTRQKITFKFPFSPAEVVEHFRKYYGPTQKAFAALADDAQAGLRSDLEQLWTANNMATDGTTEIESEFLEVIAIRA